MAVKALYDYSYPSRSRQELYGDDQLVNVWWQNNPTFCAAACFRAPKALPWKDFIEQFVEPWAASDPDFRTESYADWAVDGKPLDPHDASSLAELGVGHKSVLSFRAPTRL
jgi:phenol hydroxylase P4 protein